MAEEEEDLPVEEQEIELTEPPSQQEEDGEEGELCPTTSPVLDTSSSDQTNSSTNDSPTLHSSTYDSPTLQSEFQSVEEPTISPSVPLPPGATNGSAEKKRQNSLSNNNKSPAKSKFLFFRR